LLDQLIEADLDKTIKARDDVLMSSMVYALQRCIGNGNQEFTWEDLENSGGINAEYLWLLKYWLKLLANSDYLTLLSENRFRINECNMTHRKLEELWSELKEAWIPELGSEVFLEYIYQCAINLNGLLSKDVDPIKLLYPEGKNDIVTEMYVENKMSRYLNECICNFVSKYAKEHNHLKILEVGAGTCATTLQVVEVLENDDYNYHVTDVSGFFLPAAQKKFENNHKMIFSVLDIDGDIVKQGFGQNQYDLIIAVGVLENARDIRKSLRNIRELIAPGGYFLFTEPVHEEPWILASQGFLMTQPEDSLRQNRAFVNRSEWENLLYEVDNDGVSITYPDKQNFLTKIGLDLYVKQLKMDRKHINSKELKSFMNDYLPNYMIPTHCRMLDRMPVTANGKVDRNLLFNLTKQKDKESSVNVYKNDNMTGLQKKILSIWEEMGIKNLDLDDDFYEHGADSLIMAQVTGKLREDVASEIPFDTLVRQLLINPTLRQISDFIENRREKIQINTDKADQDQNNIGVAEFYEAGEGPLRVYFPAGFGTVNSLRYIVPRLIAQNKGKIMTIVLGDAERFCQMNKDTAITQLSEEYLKLILATGYKQVQLIGYCFGGWLATTIGNRLQELGIEIVDMAIVDSQVIPWIIKDDLLFEMMFVTNFYLEFNQFGLHNGEFMEPVFKQSIEKYGYISQNALAELEYGDEFIDEQVAIRKLAGMSKRERFKAYADITKNTGEAVDANMLEDTFKAFVQTVKCVQCKMQPYVGEVRFFSVKEYSNMFFEAEKNISYWRDLCIGELSVQEIDGDHYTCVGVEENANSLTEYLGDFNKRMSSL